MGKIFFAILCIILLQSPTYSAQIFYGITGQPINAGAVPCGRYKMVKYDITGRPAYTGHHPATNRPAPQLHMVQYNIAGIPVNQVGKPKSQIGVNNSKPTSNTSSCASCSNNRPKYVRPSNVRDRHVGGKIPQRVAVNCKGLVQYRNGKPLCGAQ